MTLQQLYDKHKRGDWPDKGSVHSYIDVYESILATYRKTANNILEIGLMSGESLRMWNEYFDGDVYGIDCDIKPVGGMADLTEAIAEGLRIVIGDATSPKDIEKYFGGLKFDVIIEDAQHDLPQQLAIYHNLKNYLSPTGIYVIEDVQDIDFSRKAFEMIDPNKTVEILDRRHIKGRYDDVMIVIK